MPITLNAYPKTFGDDNPTTTPEDTYPVWVDFRDPDHDKIQVTSTSAKTFNDFQVTAQCTPGAYYLRQTFPPGWSSSPNPYGWACGANAYGQGRSPFIFYYFNDPNYGTGDGNSFLYTPTTYDFSTHVGVQIDYYHYWNANYPSGSSDGYIQASTDGGATWITLREYHWNNPSSDQGDRLLEITGVNGYVMEGLGSAEYNQWMETQNRSTRWDELLSDVHCCDWLLFDGFEI